MHNLTGFRKITNFGFSKYRLPNLLAYTGLKLFLFFKRVSRLLVRSAIFLNPNHPLFKQKLDIIESNKNNSSKKTVFISSIPDGCKKLGQQITFLNASQTIQITKPKVINPDFRVSSRYETTAFLPDTYVAKLENVLVFGGTDLILMDDKQALYDELARKNKKTYEIKSPIIKKISRIDATLNYNNQYIEKIKNGVHFLKDHSINYFHWLVECLPRLLLIDQISEAKNFPLLIDTNLAPQQLDALKLINESKRKLIPLIRGNCYSVNKLYYPSQLSVIHDNLHSPIGYSEDIVYSPLALTFVRNFFLKKLDLQKPAGFRKIYISRKGSSYRNITNEKEIEQLMVSNGFEIVFPEKLTFATQVKLFSQAKAIVGQSGAGMANLLFAPENCKTLIFMSDDKQTNLHMFHALCEAVGLKMQYLLGKSRKNYSIHSHFKIDLKLLADYIHGI
jgi:hypothetical protein